MTDDVTSTDHGMKEAFRIDEAKVSGHVDKLVRESVQQTLNGLLEAEADRLCQASRYERSPDRQDTRSGSYPRSPYKLQTKAGEVILKVPRLRSLSFETQIIEQYKRRKSNIEKAMIEMCLAAPGSITVIVSLLSLFRGGAGKFQHGQRIESEGGWTDRGLAE